MPTSHFVSSPLGLVPKHDGGWRRIHDLSHPAGSSVNDFILRAHGALEYTAFDDAVDALIAQGRGALLVKKDLSDAFRHIPIAMNDRWLLGFFWDGIYWQDCYLPFGLRTAPYIFDLFAKALHFILVGELNYTIILHYLDDFFGIFPPDANIEEYSQIFNTLCAELGLAINFKKDVLGTLAEFLGIEVNTITMTIRLPDEKLHRTMTKLSHALANSTISHHDLQTLVGLLQFAGRVIKPGRPFLRRLHDTLAKPTLFHHITTAVRDDLRWWDKLLRHFNGICLRQLTMSRRDYFFWSDASGTHGFGSYILESETGQPSPDFTISCGF